MDRNNRKKRLLGRGDGVSCYCFILFILGSDVNIVIVNKNIKCENSLKIVNYYKN